jgi:mannose-6-phosphate isomerase-like protein (cupin superfamily)
VGDPYTIKNLTDVEDSAAKFGHGDVGEARFINDELETEQTGLSHHKLNPNARQAFGHRHEDVEEVYVVLAGAGQVKLDDEIVDVNPRDAIRVEPSVVRAFQAGPDGLEVLAFSPQRKDDRGEVLPDWWSD